MNKLIVFLLCTLLFSCVNIENNNEIKTNSPNVIQSQNLTQTQVSEGTYLPSLPMDELKILWDNCNAVDFLYYELPISTSLNDQYSIQQSLRHVSETPVSLINKNNCKPIARVFYKNEGEDLIEAEVYFSQGCSFYVFFKNSKPVFSNLMTNEGIKHFNEIIQKALSL